MSLEVISSGSDSFKGSKNSKVSEGLNPEVSISMNYVQSINTQTSKVTGFRKFKEITFEQLDSYSAQSLRREFNYIYEYVMNNKKYYHFFLDIDSFTTIEQFKDFKDSLDELSTVLGPYTLGGYSNNLEFCEEVPLRYRSKAKKIISLHVSYYTTCISAEDYKTLIDPRLNKLVSKQDKGLKFKNISLETDPSIYSFLNKERLMRIAISSKEEDNQELIISGNVIYGANYENAKNSENLISCKGKEVIIDLKDLEGLLYEPNELKTKSNIIKQVSINKQESEYNPELSTLKFVLSYIYYNVGEHGDKDSELAMKVSGIVVSALNRVASPDDLKEILYNWYNTDKNGKDYPHESDNICDKFVDTYYGKPNETYDNVPPDVYLKALIKLVEDKKTRKFLKQRVQETFHSITLVDSQEFHTFDSIEFHSYNEIVKLRTNEEKVQLLCKSVRYDPIKRIFYVFTTESYRIVDIKSENFKLGYLPIYFNGSKACTKAYEDLMRLTSLKGIPRIQVTDIYRHNPLEDVQDESPKTKDRDIGLFEEFFEQLFKKTTNEVKQYIKKWVATMIQSPGSVEVAILILSGVHGTGKTLLTKLLAFLLYIKPTVNFSNNRDMYIDSPFTGYEDKLEDHTGKFNGKTGLRIFSGIQELNDIDTTSDVMKLVDVLKRLTDPSKGVQKKGIDTVDVQNICQILICTNSNRPLPIEHTERRYLPIEINNEHARDKKFWSKYYKGFSEPYFIKHIYDYFKGINITDFETEDIPRTELLIRMIAISLKTVHKFVCLNFNECVKGLSYSDFLKLIRSKELKGKYSSEENFWQDYVNTYHCRRVIVQKQIGNTVKNVANYIPSEDDLQSIEDIYEIYSELYHREQWDIEDFEFAEEKQESTEVTELKSSVDNTIKEITKTCESRKGNYLYILSSEIPDSVRSELITKIESDGWTTSKNLPNPESGKLSSRGWRKNL